MEKFIIEGGHPLTGDVTPAGNKNAALPLLAAVFLTEKEVTLHNVPRIGDVGTMLQLLGEMGVKRGARCICALATRALLTRAPISSSKFAAPCCWPGPCWDASARPCCLFRAVTASAGAGWTRICWRWKP